VRKTDHKKEKEEPKPLNNTSPLWLKNPRDCTDEEYKHFYHEVFQDFTTRCSGSISIWIIP
jgi:molecular chaperone HtpG